MWKQNISDDKRIIRLLESQRKTLYAMVSAGEIDRIEGEMDGSTTPGCGKNLVDGVDLISFHNAREG